MKYQYLHPWRVSFQKAIEIQKDLAKQIIIKDTPFPLQTVAGVDAAYDDASKKVIAGVVVLKFPEMTILEEQIATLKNSFPYVPGLLTFREGPAILAAFKKLRNRPDVAIFDGQGVAHPRQMGIATHLGLWLKIPTIGCAKNILIGSYKEPGMNRGNYSFLKLGNRVCGVVLRTRDYVKPVFVSPGHLIGFRLASKIILACTEKYRLPQPIRIAHRLVKLFHFPIKYS